LVLNYLQFFSDFTTSLSSEEPKAVSVVEETPNTEKTPPEEINKEFRSAEEVPEDIKTPKEFRSAEEVPEDIKTPEVINTEYRSAEETNSSTKNQLDGIENLQRQGN
jgi:hypothetical protein